MNVLVDSAGPSTRLLELFGWFVRSGCSDTVPAGMEPVRFDGIIGLPSADLPAAVVVLSGSVTFHAAIGIHRDDAITTAAQVAISDAVTRCDPSRDSWFVPVDLHPGDVVVIAPHMRGLLEAGASGHAEIAVVGREPVGDNDER